MNEEYDVCMDNGTVDNLVRRLKINCVDDLGKYDKAEVYKYICEIERLLQEYKEENKAHKQKEEKLREYCNNKRIKTNLPLYTKEVIAESKIANDILQILNEGE